MLLFSVDTTDTEPDVEVSGHAVPDGCATPTAHVAASFKQKLPGIQ